MHRLLVAIALLGLPVAACSRRVVTTRRAALALPAAAIAWPAIGVGPAAAADEEPMAPALAPVATSSPTVAAPEGGVVEQAEAVPAAPPAPPVPSAFDFDVPFRGEPRDIQPFLGKATLVVNVKFDDPISLDQMPGLTAALDKYKDQGLHILAFPTDQGWFEAEDSNTLRLMFKSTFSFGSFPTAVVFDKADLLGTNALPLYTWMTRAMPNPWGANRIVFNYEKFLLGADGVPLRRYPRKFPVSLIEKDLEAVLAGQPLPAPSAKFTQAWEDSKREAIKSEYAFKPGLNYYKTGSPASRSPGPAEAAW